MSVHMITGHLGYAHVQPQDEANMNNRMIGEGRFTFNSSMSYKKTNNVLSITAKGLMIDGRRFDIDAENVTITTGTAGLYRKDRVVLTYTMNMEDADKMGVESAYLEVIRGIPANSKASAVLPAYVDAAIDSVNTFAQIPLYNVEINETTIENITSLIGSKNITMEQARGHIADKNIHITSTERTNWNDANSKKHTHSNKSIIDKITQTLLDNWSAAYTHISDSVKHITADERTKWNQAASPVDNLNETTTGKSLDAHQGYVLNEAISTNSYGEYAGGKNLFKPKLINTWQSTCIIDENDTITLTSTGTSGVAYARIGTLNLKANTEYTFNILEKSGDLNSIQLFKDSTELVKILGASTNTYTPTDDMSVTIFAYVIIGSGKTTSFKLMVTTDGVHDDYEPYIKSNYQLGNDKADKSEVCVNLLKPELEKTTTKNGVTITDNGDGTFTLNGTATAYTYFELKKFDTTDYIGKTLRITGTKGLAVLFATDNSSQSSGITDFGDGVNYIIKEWTSGKKYFYLYVKCNSGDVLSNVTIKPMITTDLTATYDDFVPYTGNKGRINEEVAELRDNTYYTSEEKCIGNLLGDQLYRVTFIKTYSSATAIATGVDVLLNGQGGLLEGNSTFNSIKDLVNVESFIETPTYKLTNYLAVKKDKTGYFYVRNIVDSVPATRLILTLYYTKN